MFYDNFTAICENMGYSPTRVLTALGISKGSLGRWKDGGEPRNEFKKAIANYLGITVAELMSGEIAEKPATPKDDELTDDEIKLLAMRKMLPNEYKEMLDNLAKMLLRGQQ